MIIINIIRHNSDYQTFISLNCSIS